MSTILDIIKFFLFIIFTFAIPGYTLARLARIDNFKGRIFLSLSLGFVLLCLAAFASSVAVWVLIVGSLFVFLAKRYFLDFVKFRKPQLSPYSVGIGLIILLGIVFQSLAAFRSGLKYDFGIGYWGPLGHDGIWHQALINQLIKPLPPVNPGLSGTSLTNYHYFYDLLVAETYKLTGISTADLLFRFYPGLFSFLLGIGTYILVKSLFKQKYTEALALFFVYFGGSFGFIVEWIRDRSLGGESAFWANQPVSMNLNPPFAVSLLITIGAILAFAEFEKRRNFFSAAILVLLAGAAIEFKVYAGVIILGGLGAAALIKLAFERKRYLAWIFGASLVLAVLVFLPQNSASGSLVALSPFWLVNSMIEFGDRVGWVKLAQAVQAYQQGGVWLKLILAESLALAIFVVGNLGTRIVGVFYLRKQLFENSTVKFLLAMATISFVLPILFVQKGVAWNTIQFLYYFLYFAAIFAGLVLGRLLESKKRSALTISFIAFVLLVTPISSFSTFKNGFFPPPSRLTMGELEALNFLKEQPGKVVLTHPYEAALRADFKAPYPLSVYETSAYVSAFSEKQVFVEDEFQQEIFQNDYKLRLAEASKFFSLKDAVWSRNFLSANNISYIYLPKLFGIRLNEKEFNVVNIFENEEAIVYKLQQ